MFKKIFFIIIGVWITFIMYMRFNNDPYAYWCGAGNMLVIVALDRLLNNDIEITTDDFNDGDDL